MNTIDVYGSIYEDVFCNTFNQSCYVFLCGGAGKEHIRNKTRTVLETEKFQILYPEDLFMEMLNRNKKSDLLEYENLLAENSDIICIICESIGSAVELGAFIQNEDIKKKMVIAINQEYSRDNSFVMMGPVKHLKKTDPNNIILYKSSDPEALGNNLSKVFRRLNKKSTSNKNQSFKTMSAYIGFIPIIVYFFQRVSRKALYKDLKNFLKLKDILPTRYNEIFNASIKYLIKSGTLITEFDIDENDEAISISLKGYNETINLLSRSSSANKTMLHDKIRCAILKGQPNN
ncbi:MAG: retron St85 family effector protein [Christensenellaceae bacterium]